MDARDTPVSIYGILFGGETADWTVEAIEDALRSLPDAALRQAEGLASIACAVFERAFGRDDGRYQAAFFGLGALVEERDRRGLARSTGTQLLKSFRAWGDALAAGGPGVEAIPTIRLLRTRTALRAAVERLGPADDRLRNFALAAQYAAEAVLFERGVLAEAPPRPGFQA